MGPILAARAEVLATLVLFIALVPSLLTRVVIFISANSSFFRFSFHVLFAILALTYPFFAQVKYIKFLYYHLLISCLAANHKTANLYNQYNMIVYMIIYFPASS